MKRMIMGVFISFLLLSTIAFNGFFLVKGETKAGNWNFTEEDRSIGLFVNNMWQTVQLINYSFSLEKTSVDKDGNPIAILQFPESKLKPGENISYTVTYYALSKPRQLPNISEQDSGTLETIPEELKKNYCGEGDPWLVNDPELRDLAQNIAENETKVLTIVKKFVGWIGNIDYQANPVPLYPNETYTARSGDCDDQAILFITLCRILEIPSFLQIGCIHMPTTPPTQDVYWEGHLATSLKHIGWHGWAMVYVPPWGWLPVDFTYVIGGPADSLNAIKRAAITSQKTLQYMNISQTDYVDSSRTYRDFLKNNDFYVYTEDEMMETSPTNKDVGFLVKTSVTYHNNNNGEDALEPLFPETHITVAVVIIVAAAGAFMYIWRRKKSRELESNKIQF